MGKSVQVRYVGNKKQKVPSYYMPRLLWEIVSTLFPQHPETIFPIIPMSAEDIPPVSTDEVLDAVKRVRDAAARDIYRIPNQALKPAIRMAPSMFTRVFTDCLKEGFFRAG